MGSGSRWALGTLLGPQCTSVNFTEGARCRVRASLRCTDGIEGAGTWPLTNWTESSALDEAGILAELKAESCLPSQWSAELQAALLRTLGRWRPSHLITGLPGRPRRRTHHRPDERLSLRFRRARSSPEVRVCESRTSCCCQHCAGLPCGRSCAPRATLRVTPVVVPPCRDNYPLVSRQHLVLPRRTMIIDPDWRIRAGDPS